MIELRRRPCRRRVAGFAGLREALLGVIGIIGVLEILQMASHTRRHRQVVVIVDMAICAGSRRHRVASRQRETGKAVVEVCIRPRICRVAGLAFG